MSVSGDDKALVIVCVIILPSKQSASLCDHIIKNENEKEVTFGSRSSFMLAVDSEVSVCDERKKKNLFNFILLHKIIKMRANALFVLSFFMCGYYAVAIETTTDLPMIISETEIERNASGHCLFEIK